jgi:L-fuconolactonase
MKRSQFLAFGSSLIASTLTSGSVRSMSVIKSEDWNDPMPIIDTHQHLWDIERFKEGWSRPPFDRNFNMADYLAAVDGLNVVKAVYLEVAVPPAKRFEEGLYAIEVCEASDNPTAGAVIAGDPRSPDFESYILKFEGNPYIKGLRYFFSDQSHILLPQVVKNIRFLGQMGMHFEFVVPVQWLASIAELRNLCPDTAFAINHCGNLDPRVFFPKATLHDSPLHTLDEWQKPMQSMAATPNTICKISGIITKAPGYKLTAGNLAPAIDRCLDIFGPDRVVFGSDWPVCLKGMEIREWVTLLKAIVEHRPVEEKKQLFHDNAVRFYRI